MHGEEIGLLRRRKSLPGKSNALPGNELWYLGRLNRIINGGWNCERAIP